MYLGDKRTSLSHHFIIVIGKKFYNADLVVSSNYMGQPGGQYFETFYGRMLQIFIISYSICPWQAFQACPMFAGEAKANLSEAPFRCSALG